jgi:hypothetical protein
MKDGGTIRMPGIAAASFVVLFLTGCDIALPGTGGASDVPCSR